MKKTIILLIIVMASLVIAEDPPGLENHQFYGTVAWDAGVDYKFVTAKIGGNEYQTPISEIECKKVCTGKYGYTETLNVQGSGTVVFYLDAVKAGEAVYKAWENTNLVLDISTLPAETCEVTWQCADWSTCKENKYTRTCSRTDQCGNVTAQKPIEEKLCVSLEDKKETTTSDTTTGTTSTTQKTVPKTTTAPTPTPTPKVSEPVVEIEEEGSNLIWWILGIILVIGAIVALVLVLKKKPQQPAVQYQ